MKKPKYSDKIKPVNSDKIKLYWHNALKKQGSSTEHHFPVENFLMRTVLTSIDSLRYVISSPNPMSTSYFLEKEIQNRTGLQSCAAFLISRILLFSNLLQKIWIPSGRRGYKPGYNCPMFSMKHVFLGLSHLMDFVFWNNSRFTVSFRKGVVLGISVRIKAARLLWQVWHEHS